MNIEEIAKKRFPARKHFSVSADALKFMAGAKVVMDKIDEIYNDYTLDPIQRDAKIISLMIELKGE